MLEKVKKLAIALTTGFGSWLVLSYVFFPIKLSAAADIYFAETMTHMIPLKVLITTVFVLFSIFMYEQGKKKKLKLKSEKADA